MNNILYPTTNLLSTEQIKLAKGEGVYLFDENGNRYLDGMAGLWCSALGHGNKELIDAIHEQYETLSFSHLFGGKTHQAGIDLADKLNSILPLKNAKLFFGNSGSDANDTLLKIVRYFNQVKGRPNKTKIITRDRAYHGVTMAAASLTGISSSHRHFDLPFEALGVVRIDAPYYYHNALPGESEESFCDRLIQQLESTIHSEGPETIAAFIAEPVNGAGGVIVPPDNYFARVQEILNRNEILFLDDEVICGFGRTGHDFGATSFNFTPDTMTLAKGISSAYFPISVSAISNDIFETVVQGSSDGSLFGHGFTYSGHPVGCVAALKTIEIYERERLYTHAAKMGKYLHKKLQNTLGGHCSVGEIRGIGLIAGIEFVRDSSKKVFFDDNTFVQECQRRCEENGLILRALPNNTLAICPPLVVEECHIDELVDILQKSLTQVIQSRASTSSN